jgi:hypothetical protein
MTASLRSIADALGGDAVSGRYVLCPGPGHSRKDRSLHVRFKADGTFTVTSYAGDDWRECKDFIRERLGLSSEWRRHDNDDQPAISLRDRGDDEPARIRSALKRWETATPIAGTLAERYLASRGLAYSGDAIRYRANDRSMVALITDAVTAEPCGVHVTYLDRDGHKIARKMYGRAAGAVVRLSADEDVGYGLAIGEGIETCLATVFNPIWACLSAGTMRNFPVLGGIQCLSIYADHDHAGIAAANTCGRRWHEAGAEIHILAPPEVGFDFADLRGAA